MGMYTEIVVKAAVNNQAASVLKMLTGKGPDVPLPDHPFFGMWRARYCLQSSSYYHHPEPIADFVDPPSGGDYTYVYIRTDFKNYEHEADAFFDWLRSQLNEPSTREVIGYQWYEEDREPALEVAR